ncbi:MAG: hypothetical protein AAF662_10085 [Pseudomonadota bacterium]
MYQEEKDTAALMLLFDLLSNEDKAEFIQRVEDLLVSQQEQDVPNEFARRQSVFEKTL